MVKEIKEIICDLTGIETKEEREKKEKRAKEVWDALNDLVCTVDVYSTSISQWTDPEYRPGYLKPEDDTEEYRMKQIAHYNKRIKQCEEKCMYILTKW